VVVPPHSEAWRARSGGETCTPLEPFRQRPTGLRWQFYYYASHLLFAVVSTLLTVRRTNGIEFSRRTAKTTDETVKDAVQNQNKQQKDSR